MNHETKLNLIIGITGIMLMAALLSLMNSGDKFGAAEGNVTVKHSTTTDYTIGATAVQIFSTSTCAARIVTVSNNALGRGEVRMTFTDTEGQRPTVASGHSQAATSTISYGAEDYGCGTGYAISTTGGNVDLTVTETF